MEIKQCELIKAEGTKYLVRQLLAENLLTCLINCVRL